MNAQAAANHRNLQLHLDNSVPPPKEPPPSTAIELQPANSGLPKHLQDEPSIVWLTSIRTQIRITNDVDPMKSLQCLFIIATLVIISCIAMISAIDSYIMDIYIDMDTEGTYVWSIGWSNAQLSYLDDATCGNACLYKDNTIQEITALFPIPNTLKYMKNAGYLLISLVGITLFWIIYILAVLCERRNYHELLYVKWGCILIPERPTVYFAFQSINTLTCACFVYYMVLIIYGYIEASFYTSNACISLLCGVYIIPHYAFCALLLIILSITCCAFGKTRSLDPIFDEKNLGFYYPDNVKKAQSEVCRINLQYLLKSISVIRMICILSFIMFVSFRDVGMISIVFDEETQTNVTPLSSVYLQFEGLNNKNEIIYDSYLNLLDLNNATLNVSTLEPFDFEEEDGINTLLLGFSNTALYWDYCIIFIFAINILVIAPYLIFIVERYSSNQCMKLFIIAIVCVELLAHAILMAMYYTEYGILFAEYIKPEMEFELYQVLGSRFNVWWYPDWGVIIAILLWFYLLKFMYTITKAI